MKLNVLRELTRNLETQSVTKSSSLRTKLPKLASVSEAAAEATPGDDFHKPCNFRKRGRFLN